MCETIIPALPQDVQAFLMRIVELYLRGPRDEAFAEWAATRATLMLEYYGLLY